MHGLGNDFLIFNEINESLLNPKFIRKISNRKTGIGCDLVVFVKDSLSNYCDIYAKFINSDGSVAETCGNALRCIGKEYFRIKKKNNLAIETETRIIDVEDYGNGDICVDMGEPKYDCNSIPLLSRISSNELEIDLEYLKKGYAVNVGNPHLIFFVDEVRIDPLVKNSKQIEKLGYFPEGVNVSVVQLIDENTIKIITHERGVGITEACGSGACASVCVAHKKKMVSEKVCVEMIGGKLNIELTNNNHILMIGKATKVFEGIIEA